MSEIMVTLAHARAASLGNGVMCAAGIRAWCERHRVDLRAFSRDGLPISQVDAIDDAFAQRAAAIARAEADHG